MVAIRRHTRHGCCPVTSPTKPGACARVKDTLKAIVSWLSARTKKGQEWMKIPRSSVARDVDRRVEMPRPVTEWRGQPGMFGAATSPQRDWPRPPIVAPEIRDGHAPRKGFKQTSERVQDESQCVLHEVVVLS